MAINKVINKSTKSHGAMRNVINYVLQNQKVIEGYVEITGPYSYETINQDHVYCAFLEEKKMWNKDSGRMYAHNVISFHKDEIITPEECLEIGRRFAEHFFPDHQNLISVHQDKDHLHIHIVTNSVSYVDGSKLHQTKHDLEHQKQFTNNLCLEKGLTIAEKGKHFDGTPIEEGEIIAWNKNKYNLLINDSKKSYVSECAMAVLESKENCCSKEDFIQRMADRGWQTIWTDSRKHITFQNEKGEKVRDSNLSNTFKIDINKEVLLHEFERQNEIRIAQLSSERNLEHYYSRAESIIQGTAAAGTGADENPEPGNHAGTDSERRSRDNTAAFIRELSSQERASEEKRDDSISERSNREAARERSRIEEERRAREAEQRAARERAKNKERSQRSHRAR